MSWAIDLSVMNYVRSNNQSLKYERFTPPVSEFNEFEPRLKSAKNRFQLSAGLNLETLNTILSETNDI